MRKNSVRKWLHAILDFLPLLVIPIFAIYTRNENYSSNIEITINQSYYETISKYETNEPIDEQGNYLLVNDYIYKFEINGDLMEAFRSLGDLYVNFVYFEDNLGYETTYEITNTDSPNMLLIYAGQDMLNVSNDGDPVIVDINADYVYISSHYWSQANADFEDNEVIVTKSDKYFTESIYHENTPVTYNDTDVGSQFIYTLYNATDKYFNCTNLFNLEQVWNWVQLNLFSGNAPLMVYVVWQVIVYEFFMDLIFLLYSVFMFVIDFATNTLERFYRRSC